MKKNLFLFLVFLTGFIDCYSQREEMKDTVQNSPAIFYYGIDFSHAQIIRESVKHKKELEDVLFQEINNKFLLDQMDLLKLGLSTEILPDEKLIQSLNSKIPDDPKLVNVDDLPTIVKGYQLNQDTGTGLIFLVVSLDKSQNQVNLYPVIFNISTRKVIWAKMVTGKAHGGMPGLMHYWYSKIYNGIGEFIDIYKTEKAEKEGKSKPSNIFLKLQLDEIDLGFETRVSPDVNLSVEGGYRLNFLNSWHYQGEPIPVEYLYRFLAFSGFSFRVAAKCKVSNRSSIAPVIGYQRLYCKEVIYDPGGYGGGGDSEYKVWSQHNDEFVLQLIHFVNLGPAPYPVQFFYGIGIKICDLSEHYSIDGRGDHKIPSNQVVRKSTLQPCATFGVIIKLASF